MSYEYQDNKKSTDTSDIAPGAPIWFRAASGIHNNRDAGHGYSAHDPVSLTSGDTRVTGGGYESGAASTRFGEITFVADDVLTSIGNVVEIPIERRGGTVGDQVLTLEIDRDPKNNGIDYNTAVIGAYRGKVVDGFHECNVDIDISMLNQGDNFYYNPNDQSLSILMPEGQARVVLRFIIPYRNKIKSLSPAVLMQPLTYRVDEYMSDGLQGFESKFVTDYSTPAAELEHGPQSIVVNNQQAAYRVATLPVPTWWTSPDGADKLGADGNFHAREIDRYRTTARALTSQGVDNLPLYTIGRTRSVEATAYLRYADLNLVPLSGSTFWENLTGDWDGDPGKKTDYSLNYVPNKDGQYHDYLRTLTNGTHELSATASYTGADDRIKAGTGYISQVLTLGDNPDAAVNNDNISPGQTYKWGDYATSEYDPGGSSEFFWFSPPVDLKLPYGDQFDRGSMTQAMFVWEGVSSTTLPGADGKFVLQQSTTPINQGQLAPNTLANALTGESVSAFGHMFSTPQNGNVEFGANELIKSWVSRETRTDMVSATLSAPVSDDYMKQQVLYDVSMLEHDRDSAEANKANLKGYYTTCDSHLSKELFLKLTPMEAEPVYTLGKTQIRVAINANDPYSTAKHAAIEQQVSETTGEPIQVYRQNMIKHDNSAGVTYQTGDGWSTIQGNNFATGSGPTGDSLLKVLFGDPISLTIDNTTTPPTSSYTSRGSLSADDVSFLSLQPGVFTSEQFSDPAAGPPLTPGTVSLSAVLSAVQQDPDVGGVMPIHTSLDLREQTEHLIEIPLSMITHGDGTDERVWLYMQNPADTDVNVTLDSVTFHDGTVDQVLNQAISLLGTHNSTDDIYYWYSNYEQTLNNPLDFVASSTLQGNVINQGGPEKNSVTSFSLKPGLVDDMLYAIDIYDLKDNNGAAIAAGDIPSEIKQIYQLTTPGEPMVQGTITIKFIP